MAETQRASELLEFEWVVPASEAEAEWRELEESGARLWDEPTVYQPTSEELDEMSDAAFEPLMLLAGAAAASFIIERIVHALKDYQSGGSVVDLRNGRVRVTPNRSFDAGTIVVVRPDGELQIHTSTAKPLDIIKAIKVFLGIEGG